MSAGGTTYASGLSYYPNGALQQFTYGNTLVHTMTQSAVRQLPARSTDGVGVLDLGYGFDANANVSAITDYVSGRQTRAMTYDALDRLAATTSPMFGSGASYTYDELDNLTRVTTGGTAARDHYYCYDANQRLTNVKTGSCGGSSVIGLGYDVQGNLENKNGQLYDFDTGNRLREVMGLERYRYDAYGRRILTVNFVSGTILSQYSQSGQLLYQSSDRTADTTDYVYLAGSLIAQRSTANVGGAVTLKYQHTDALGTPIATTSTTGTVLERSEYEPYGKVLNRAANDRPGFTGHVEDAATGLTYMQQRYMDPGIGRFLSVDPVTANSGTGANFNRYWYANDNPYRFTDPDGRNATAVLGAEGGFFVCGPVCAGVGGVIGFGVGLWLGDKIVDKIQQNASQETASEPGTSESEEGCIYCVSGDNTSSGKDYIGSTDDLDKRSSDKSDGRDRKGAEKVDSYKKGDHSDRQNKEQKAINDRGGKDKLDNKRNEVAPKKWEDRKIDPPKDL